MAIILFDIQNNKITATKHCYTIGSLKAIMDKYPKEYLSIYAYLFYMSCLNDEENPFANTPELDKEELVLKEVGGQFSIDDELIYKALEVCKILYSTPTYEMYLSAKIGVERMSKYIRNTPIVDGRDGNTAAYLKYLERFSEVRKSFEETWRAFRDEQGGKSRGGNDIAYDQQ